MEPGNLKKDLLILLTLFIVSRLLLSIAGITMDTDAIAVYWQYISLHNLQHDLLNGVWYNHTQPPVFNLFLGSILKISGEQYPIVFPFLFKVIGAVNVVLLYLILRNITTYRLLPLVTAAFYMLSPATMIFECELFYTIFITCMLLISLYFLVKFDKEKSTAFAFGFLLPLAVSCLTRSMYNIVWLVVIAGVITCYYRHSAFSKLLMVSLTCILLVSAWYVKNLVVFGKFTTSTWLGMNMARNVFQDTGVKDSSRIESIEPFSKISAYKNFISGKLETQYAGLNDTDLLREYKNGAHINENHISYIEVSDQYADASKKYIRTNPLVYLKNVGKSCVVFFAPATRYPYAEPEARKIRWYDAVYSANLVYFATGKQERRIAMLVSALPKIIMYGFVFAYVIMTAFRKRSINAISLFIVLTFAYIFAVSSLLEHFENMRFRYEIEPMFLVLLVLVLSEIYSRRQVRD